MVEKKDTDKTKITLKRSLEQICEPALNPGLTIESKLAYEQLVTYLKDGTFSQRQTKANISHVGDRLLFKLREQT